MRRHSVAARGTIRAFARVRASRSYRGRSPAATPDASAGEDVGGRHRGGDRRRGEFVREGGVAALVRGAGCYVALCLAWLLLDVALAWVALSGRLPIVPWRPNLLFRVYPVSKSNLLDRVSRRFERPRRRPPPSGASSSSTDPHRAFGAVVGTCPFAHIGGASLANAALRAQPVKAPLYRAFEAFAGEGVFTAEGSDWAEKRAEVLAAFATAGLEPLADASKSVARRLAAEIERDLARDLTPGETKALPALQRATLRATFEYLAGRSIAEALEATAAEEPRDVNTKFHPSSPGAPSSSSSSSSNTASSSTSPFASAALRWEYEYLAAATSLRHLIPARARSVWMASDWLYSLSPVGRLEARCVRAARRLPELAVRAAREGSPLAILAAGPGTRRRRRRRRRRVPGRRRRRRRGTGRRRDGGRRTWGAGCSCAARRRVLLLGILRRAPTSVMRRASSRRRFWTRR